MDWWINGLMNRTGVMECWSVGVGVGVGLGKCFARDEGRYRGDPPSQRRIYRGMVRFRADPQADPQAGPQGDPGGAGKRRDME